METKNNLKAVFGILFLSVVIVGSIVFMQSTLAKGLDLDILLELFSQVVFIIALLAILKRNWHNPKTWPKIMLGLLIAVTAIFTTNDLIEDWHRLPWVKADAFRAADTFLVDLKENDYAAAIISFTPQMQRCVNPEDLMRPDVQPLSWELNTMDEFSNIEGMATFSDGQELPLTIRMVWFEGQWLINGFWFGNWDAGKLDYSSMN